MAVKLFILGLPGSGKSAIGRHIQKYILKKYKQKTYLFNDYAILNAMSKKDKENQFKPANLGGFDVLNLDVFDMALVVLEKTVSLALGMKELALAKVIIIEFSRNDYQRAFRQLDFEFFQNAYFIHLSTDVETCKQRIAHRIAYPYFEDDYPVSDYIFEHYYYGDDGSTLPETLNNEYGIDKNRVLSICNNSDKRCITRDVNALIDTMMQSQMMQTIGSSVSPTRSQILLLS